MDVRRFAAPAGAFLAAFALAAPAAAQAPPKKGNDAAIQRQAEQIRRLTEAQQKLQAENSNLAARQSVLEDDLKAAAAVRDRLAADRRRDDGRLATVRRDLESSEAKAARLATELEEARRDLQRTGERLAAGEQALAAQREQAGTLSATLRARDSALAQLTASDARRGADLAQCRDHNRELARLSSDLIDAIERGGMGEALVATAPFSGYKRVRIETLVQDYRDRVAEQRVTDPKR
jgi:chromosome segregation ATPase